MLVSKGLNIKYFQSLMFQIRDFCLKFKKQVLLALNQILLILLCLCQTEQLGDLFFMAWYLNFY